MAQYKNLSDEQLLQYYRASTNAEYIGALLQRYTLLLLGVALKYLKEKDAAQDAVQAVFLKALTHLPQGEIQNFKGWLYILMRNHCLQILRDKTYIANEEVLNYVPAEDDERETHLLKEVTLSRLEASLAHIPREQEQCIRMFYLQKKSYQQIQDSTGFTFAQVKSFIQNGKRNLRIILLKQSAGER